MWVEKNRRHDDSLGSFKGLVCGDISPNSVYVHISAPHLQPKEQTAFEAKRKSYVAKSWITICLIVFYSFVFTAAISVWLAMLKPYYWKRYTEAQSPLLSLPVQTSWRLLITPHVSCSDDPPFVALATMTSAADASVRNVVRNTWGSLRTVAESRVRLFFIAGTSASQNVQSALEAEAAQYGDILQHAAPDTYSNLALKTATIVDWLATSCPQAKFFVKADTDTLLNLELLVPYLKKRQNEQDLALGVRLDGMPVVTSPQSRNYQDPLVYPNETFPPYLSGACYIVSGDLVKKLSKVLADVPRVRNEDTFVGMCLKRLGVEPQSIGRQAGINPWFDPSKGPCAAFRWAAAHPFRKDLLWAAWTWWHTVGAKMCS